MKQRLGGLAGSEFVKVVINNAMSKENSRQQPPADTSCRKRMEN